MTFSEKYGDIISPFAKKYKISKNEKGRKAIVKNAANAVLKSREQQEDEGVDLPKDLETAITRYIKRVIKKESAEEGGDPKPTKIKQFYKIRDIVVQNHQDLVQAEIPHQKGTKEYLGCYQRAVTEVQKNLDEEQLEEAQNLVDLWNEQGAPSDLQLKRAKKKLPREMKKKVEEWKFRSGAVMMCLVAYSDGQDVRAFHVESSPANGNLFTNSFPDWRDGTYEMFKDWAGKQFGTKELDSDDEAEIPVHRQKAKDIQFEVNKRGFFILPPRSNFKTIRERQRVIRGYIGAVYREFTGYPRAAFPYILASKDGQTIYSPESVPEDFRLSDPDHLKSFSIDALYAHLLGRQKKGLSPFVILNANPLHTVQVKPKKDKGKKKQQYVDVSSDEDRGGEYSQGEDQDGERGDSSEETENETDGERDPVLKFGPPKRKPPPPVHFGESLLPVAGPSKLPPSKNASKKNKSGPAKGGESPQEEADHSKANLPKQRSQKIRPLSKREESPLQDAGPSKPSKKSKDRKSGEIGLASVPVKGKKDRKREGINKVEDEGLMVKGPTTRNSGKRKLQEDLATEPPPKFAKTNSGKKSGKPGGKGQAEKPTGIREDGKRKRDGEELQSPTRKRMRKDDSTLPPSVPSKEKDPVPPSQPSTKTREAARVKQFPAGNAATSASRMSFLRSLCNLPKFSSLVDLVPTMPKPSGIPTDYPSWASWNSREVYLPPNFHSSASFKSALKLVRSSLIGPSLKGGKVDAPLLLLGLMYREVSLAMEIEPGVSNNHPLHLSNSPLGIRQVNEIEKLLDGVVLDS